MLWEQVDLRNKIWYPPNLFDDKTCVTLQLTEPAIEILKRRSKLRQPKLHKDDAEIVFGDLSDAKVRKGWADILKRANIQKPHFYINDLRRMLGSRLANEHIAELRLQNTESARQKLAKFLPELARA